jgi:RNA polymerase sigma factor (sigma-70 family)
MIHSKTISPLEPADAELVAQAQSRDHHAFGRIVARYQSLICALAYNSTGNVAKSEDLAQEAVVVAWQQLPGLREPEKLRSWLCGIVRNLGRRARRDEKYAPVLRAQQLEDAEQLPAPEAQPLEQAISREEEDLLWRQLEAIPETYRVPLILYYRQHASIEQVALALEMSEDAVRQRLTRGRRLLQERVLAFVENVLGRTSPKPAFTQNVLSALPGAASSAKAVGATLAATGSAKAAAAVAGPIGGLFALLGGTLVSRRAIADEAKSPREQRFVDRIAWIQVAVAITFMVALFATGWMVKRGSLPQSPIVRDLDLSAGFFCLWAINTGLWRHRTLRQLRIQTEDGTFDEAEWKPPLREAGGPAKKEPMSFSLFFKRAALSFVWIAIMAFRAPWRPHFALAVGVSVVLPLLAVGLTVFLVTRQFQRRGRYQRPSLGFLVGFPLAVTLLAINADQFTARTAGTVSVPAVVLLNAGVILIYAIWATLFVRSTRSRFFPRSSSHSK